MYIFRNNIFLLAGIFVCLAIGGSSCGTSKKNAGRQTPRQGTVTEKYKDNTEELKRKEYIEWQKQRVNELEPLISRYFDEEALHASCDSTVSVYIPAEKLFRPNSSTPFLSSVQTIDILARLLHEYPDLLLCIAGHESGDTNEAYNEHLSGKRARNLALLLESKWQEEYRIPSDTRQQVRIASAGYGNRILTGFTDFPYKTLIEFRFQPHR